MKITRLANTRPLLTIGGALGGGAGGVASGPSGQVPTANGSNSVAWGSNVAVITSNASNAMLGPFVNLASGSNIIFTLDQGPFPLQAVPSNTLRIHSVPNISTSFTQSYIGYNTVGASNEAPGNLHVLAKSITTTGAVMLLGIGIHARENGGNVTNLMVGLWADNSGAFGKLLAMGTSGAVNTIARDTTFGWIEIPVTAYLSASTTYWIGVMFDAGVDIKYDTGGNDRTVTSTDWWLPDGAVYSQTDTTKKYSIRGNTIA